ncbi:MAG: exodeoxyribonuclease III [Candidatus Brocadia sp.]|jgi:exodeoxyribonuclease-3|nr:Exodeoxyribonuclease III [Candidatus Brocadia fulgida]MCC6326304.1 exodeoxyribonuclease III [Candidatus Brocadia sp.]MCE7911006.1 exodeoxyribonuclease III [Candidatus Brocadia sp. AMX3]OQZ01555.1 MAG: exodeoxyribonuclease III [Candidatus Brocadia sp. UTAMX2]MDG5995740.1 exodeoxyribonuclease III [Candidatus Brocadia sp.]
MKIASFNVNSIRARLPIVIGWIQNESPDVLCLQETKVTDAEFPRGVFEDMKYHTVFRGEKSYNGVAILSKISPKNIRAGFDEFESEGTRLIAATVQNISVINTYVPQGAHPLLKQFRYKLDWFQRLHEYFDKNYQPDQDVLWLGDFNVAPEPADVYDPEHLLGSIGYHPDEHAAILRLKKWGFVDVFRLHQHGSEQYTFWDYRVKDAIARKRGWRVDHIWATRPLAQKSTKAWIDVAPRLLERPSDHTLIVAEFEV